MIVRDLMATEFLSVPPGAPVGAIADLLSKRGLPDVPVVDADHALLGLVTEADLLRRLSLPDEPRRGWLHRLFEDQDLAAARYARAHGMAARDVMTPCPWTIEDGGTAGHAARLLDECAVRRLPVLRDGRLVGMISRADLLRALLPSGPPAGPESGTEAAEAASDGAIRRRIAEGVRNQAWAYAPMLSIDVRDGVVELGGQHRSPAIRQGILTLLANIAGVRRVVDSAADPPPRQPWG